MKNRRKLNIILIIFLIVLALGLGYAYLTTTLSINGTTDVDSNTWNVYFDNVEVMEGSVNAELPVIGTNKTFLSFSINLSKPGDYYEFTFDVKNAGTIDAMIDSVIYEVTEGDPYYAASFTSVSYSYEDGIPIEENQLLKNNSTEKIRVRVKYRTDINQYSLPSENQRIRVTFFVDYVQADESSIEVRDYIYTDKILITGEDIDNNTNIIHDYDTMINNLISPFFIRYTIYGNKVYESDIGYKKNDNVYIFKGNRATMDINTNYYYENIIFNNENKELFNSIFGTSNCMEIESIYRCTDGDTIIYIDDNQITILDDNKVCSIYYENNNSLCYNPNTE